MATCNINTLLSNGASFQSLDDAGFRVAQISLLKSWLLSIAPGTDVTPAAILSRGAAYQGLDSQGIRNAIFQSLCVIRG